MNLSILGPPGSGKGTQAASLIKDLKIVHISTGDMLREAVRQKTPLGEQANGFMTSGKLVPDEVIIGIVKERISQSDCEKGFLLDGFPRTIPQAQKLDEMGPRLEFVISLEVTEEECLNRLANRLACKCGMTYNLKSNPPKKAEECDRCHAPLVLREDDKPQTIKKRLQVYKTSTEPLVQYYRDSQRLLSIDAAQSPEAVYKQIMNLLKSNFSHLK